MVTFEQIKNDVNINTYIRMADASLASLGYTEHSFAHVGLVAHNSRYILETLGFPDHDLELVQIASWLHDIGNLVNRIDHSLSGAVMAFRLLNEMGMPPEDVAQIVTAIGNHDEGTAVPVNAVAAALILADKSDVRRSRVRNQDITSFDIHDRVNYSVVDSSLHLEPEDKTITLSITIDTEICAVMNYFEIFLGRMVLCRRAANYLGLTFKLDINGQTLL